jgi:hypothetical protein
VLVSGPLSGFPTIEALMVQANVFGEQCGTPANTPCEAQLTELGQLYTISLGISIGITFFEGIMYDRLGARMLAFLGAIGTGFGMIIIWAGIKYPKLNWLLYVGFPVADSCGFMNSFGMWGFIWHYPEFQAVIIGLANASYFISGILGDVLTLLVNADWELSSGFLLFAEISFCSALLAWVTAPTREEFLEKAKEYLGMEPKTTPLLTSLRSSITILGKNPWGNFLYFCSLITPYVLLTYWLAVCGAYEIFLFGDQTVNQIAPLFALLLSILSATIAPLSGIILDFIDLTKFVGIMAILITAFVGTLFIQTVAGQITNWIIGFVFLAMWSNFVVIWMIYFFPPELMGTLSGLAICSAGVTQLVINLYLPTALANIYPNSITQFIIPFGTFGGISILFIFGLTIYLFKRGIPKQQETW